MTKMIKITAVGLACLMLAACVDEGFSTDYNYNPGYYSSHTSGNNVAAGYSSHSSGQNAPQAPASGGYETHPSYAPRHMPEPSPLPEPPRMPEPPRISDPGFPDAGGYGSHTTNQQATVESNDPTVHVKPRIGAILPPRATSTSGGYSSH